ncbi:MAG: hypothetical protein HY077_14740 [Elusimicrobia bacterium]|nr:hypothetical protein [Elusimicrobiota bacterium]
MEEAKPLRCSACGGEVDIAFLGPNKDRIGVCRFCKTATDLPETHGKTHEKIVLEPGGKRTVERETVWEGPIPADSVEGKLLASGLLKPMSRDEVINGTFVYNDKTFKSFEELKEHLRRTLPADRAEQLIKSLSEKIEKGLREGGVKITQTEQFVEGGDLAPEQLETIKAEMRKKHPGAMLKFGDKLVSVDAPSAAPNIVEVGSEAGLLDRLLRAAALMALGAVIYANHGALWRWLSGLLGR